jgi:hypothetical protein
LFAALPDSRGWEGPDGFGDDVAIPILPMPAVTLHPASARHAVASGRARLFDPVLQAEKAAVRAAARAAEAAIKENCAREGHAIATKNCQRLYDTYGRGYGTAYA